MTAHRVARIGEAGYERIDGDRYRTPAWVTRHLLKHIKLDGLTWEPAAGEGDMFNVLCDAGLSCAGTDIRGFGSLAPTDFLSTKTMPLIDRLLGEGLRNIITNPPYEQAEDFIRQALTITARNAGRVAMLLGHDYDTALTKRGDLFRKPCFVGKLMLGRRISWVGLEGKSSPRQIHAWYLWDWDKEPTDPPRIIYPSESDIRSP